MLDDKGMALHGINIWQSTRLLFRKALHFNNAVGLAAVLNADYGWRRGWRSSEAAEEIMGEVVGYLYAKLFVITGA
jgi:hypothetical protein